MGQLEKERWHKLIIKYLKMHLAFFYVIYTLYMNYFYMLILWNNYIYIHRNLYLHLNIEIYCFRYTFCFYMHVPIPYTIYIHF